MIKCNIPFALKFAGTAAILALMLNTSAQATTDPVILTFSTVGDSRQDSAAPDSSVVAANTTGAPVVSMAGVGNCPNPAGATGVLPNPGLSGQDCKWLQNTTAWSKILRNVQAQKPNLLFFNGDMIMGYGKAGVPVTRNSTGVGEAAITSPAVTDIVTSDLMQFYQQYGFWRGMVANLMETGTYVVPVPGNHEVQCKRCNKSAQLENETAWRDNMGDLIIDQNRFKNLLGVNVQNLTGITQNTAPGATDGVGAGSDQSQLSYSFDIGNVHFAVINTDPYGNDGHAPTNWLSADLTAAQNRGAVHLFVFGHKPYKYYSFKTSSGTQAPTSTSSLYDKNHAAGDAFWNVIAGHNATYFSGHEHIYNIQNIPAPNGTSGSAYQVIVGAGGSPFEQTSATPVSGAPSTDREYSWGTVKIHQSGAVTLETYGFTDALLNGASSSPVYKINTISLP